MNPRVLYQMFREELESEGVGSDQWDDIPDREKIAWGKLFRRLQSQHGLKANMS